MSEQQAERGAVYERVEQLAGEIERILIDGQTPDAGLDEVLNDCIADARHLHLDELVERLEDARYLVARLPDVAESEKLPVVFALHDSARPRTMSLDGGESHLTGADETNGSVDRLQAGSLSHIALDSGQDRRDLLLLDGVQMRALRRRVRLGERLWLLSIEGDIDPSAVQTSMEREFSVIAARYTLFAPHLSRLLLLTTAAAQLAVQDVHAVLGEQSVPPRVDLLELSDEEITSREIGADTVAIPATIQTELEEIERLQFFRWLHHQQLEGQPAVTTAMQEAVDRALSVSFRQLVETLAADLDARASAAGTRTMIRVLGERLLDPIAADAVRFIIPELVDNALVHGVESADVRISRGKPAIGTIVVSIHDTERGFDIRVVDDGGGVDQEHVSRRSEQPSPGGLARVRRVARERLGAELGLRSGPAGATATISVRGHGSRFRAVVFHAADALWALPHAVVVRILAREEGQFVSDGDGWQFFRFEGTLYRLVSPLRSEPAAGSSMLIVRVGETVFAIGAEVRATRTVVAVAVGSKVRVPELDDEEATVPDLNGLVDAVELVYTADNAELEEAPEPQGVDDFPEQTDESAGDDEPDEFEELDELVELEESDQ